MKIVNNFTLINIESENSFYMTKFENDNKNINNDVDILNTVYFTSLIKNSICNLIKDFNIIYYSNDNYFKGHALFNLLKHEYNLKLNLSYHDFKVICNMMLNNKIYSHDLSQNDVNNLYLFDLNYYDKSNKIKLNLFSKFKIDFVILTILGHDKIYNILLFNHKKDLIKVNRIIKINKRKGHDKKRTFFKQNKYNYQKCKNKTLRQNEKDLIKGKKYSHNFKNNINKNNDVKKTYYDLIIDDLLFYYHKNNNIENDYFQLLDLYYHKYNLDDLKNDLINHIDYLLSVSESYYNDNYTKNLLKNSQTIKCIKIFLKVIKLYEYRINKENIKSSLNDYDNYNYHEKDFFIYHKYTNDKI